MADVSEVVTMPNATEDELVEMSSSYAVTNISVAIGLLTVVLSVLYFWLRRRETPACRNVESFYPKLRFRKREKIMFYGRKMLRRVRSFAKGGIAPSSSSTGRRTGGRESRKKKLVLSIARRLLRFRREQEPQLKPVPRELPPSLLEVDLPPGLEPSPEYRLPPELMYMLRNVRVLGHFEKPIFLELCRFMESRLIPAGSYLFRVGDPDDSIFVVQSGRVEVRIAEPHDGIDYCVKVVNPGESVHSLLSILDVLTGHSAPYRTVSSVALVDTMILRLPVSAFKIVLERFPESLVRVVQIIMVRLQRVTFMALHNYLGLGLELMRTDVQDEHELLVHSSSSTVGSPCRKVSSSRECRVAPAGAENEAVIQLSGQSTGLLSVDDENLADAGRGDQTEARKKSVGRKGPELRRSQSEITDQTSDFAAVCSRARVGSLVDDDLPISEGEGPQNTEEGNLLLTPSKRNRKVTLAENVSIIPSQLEPVQPQIENAENDVTILSMAARDIATLLGLQGIDLLAGRCVLRTVRAGTTLVREGDVDNNLLFIVSGQLNVMQQTVGSAEEQRTMYVAKAGEIIGALAVLTGEPSFVSVHAATDVRYVCIRKSDFYVILKEQPTVVLGVSNTVVRRMSSFVRQIDFALDWMLIDAGRALYRQGEHSDCVYIILTGRLRSVVELESKKKELVGEFGRGELVGLIEVLTQTNRASTMMAVRDTELAQIPDELLHSIKRRYPQVVTRLIHLLGQRILGSLGSRAAVSYSSALSEHPNIEPRSAVANLSTVAVLPASDSVPLSSFTLELQYALSSIANSLRLSSDIVQSRLGASALDPVNDYRLSSWLSQQEDVHRMVLYECDRRLTPWTQRCIRQADCVLILALADRDPAVGPLEKQLEGIGIRSQKELILLHREDGPKPRNTVEWLSLRSWCSSHHHIRCPKRVFSHKAPSVIADIYNRLLASGNPDRMSDFSRLARFLTGSSIGLVLGGGGARGCAHVGILRAMAEAGIPIDMVGGTSIGSFMGAVWADEIDVTRVRRRAREWCMDTAGLAKKLLDLTYPVTAMFSGTSFNRSIESVFGDCQIEDLWIPYFCVTTDLTASKIRVHTQGSLWRYVRASMTLSGYLPPLCDPVDGHLLLDGGYVNNLPADVMKALGAQTIIAIDVGREDDTDLTNYGDSLSGWWLLWCRWWPWAKAVKVPNMAEIQSRLAYVSCVPKLEQVRNSGYAEYVRPPIDRYHTLQFGSFDEICNVGYLHAHELFTKWADLGRISEMFSSKNVEEETSSTAHKFGASFSAETKFTDLAELVSRINRPTVVKSSSVVVSAHVSDDDEMSVTSEPAIASAAMPVSVHRRKAGSEGTSPGSVTVSSTDVDDDVERRLHDFDDDEHQSSS